MKLSLLSAGLSCGLAALLPCCERAEDSAPGASPSKREWPGYFVSVDWVARHAKTILLIDVRSREDYDRGHLPGAVSLPAGLWHEDLVGRTDRMVPAGRLEQFLGGAGVAVTDRVIFYGAGGGHGAIRAAWVLDAHGHQFVAVMPDGMRGWSARGGAMTSEPPGLPETSYRARLCGDRMANKLSVLNAISNPGIVLLDVRRGQSARSRRIPTSRGLGFDDHALRPASLQEVRELQGALRGLFGDGESCIVYSDNGIRASLVGLALRDVGKQAAVYDGGWNEWASHAGLPMENLEGALPSEERVIPIGKPGTSP